MGNNMSAKIIVFANEKGGTGKSTLAMHMIVSLMRAGKKVASFDLDARQGSLTRYIENRQTFITENGVPLPIPEHTSWTDEIARIYTLKGQIEKIIHQVDAIVIDTPGSHSPLTSEAMEMADALVTPINDSLVDLDVLALVDGETLKIKGPSHFAQTVWSSRQQRMLAKKPPLNWVVVRNRMLYANSKNSKAVDMLVHALSRRIHFTISNGFSERVVYRELFLKGLTMLDCKENGLNMPMSISSLAARQEVRCLMNNILSGGLNPVRSNIAA
ncbi:MAG: AAA family ATPase [Alphaproteobacteria bacterium]|nr:AAA family ATPase [Alphaproteobacteria bacterium]